MIRRLKGLGLLVGLSLLIGACTTQPVTPALPAPLEATAASQAESISVPTDEPSPTLPPTETPTPTATPLPTEIASPVPPAYPIPGIEIHNLSGVDLSAQAGAFWIRRNALNWVVVEPTEGERNWGGLASLEKEMIAISEQGMELILIIHYVPSWAQAELGYACGPVKAEKLGAFGAFMGDLVARYSQPPYNVRYYEMGNEPDVSLGVVPGGSQYGCWADMEDPTLNGGVYAEMLQAVYPQVKAANSDAQLLIGGLLMDCDPLDPPQMADGTIKNCDSSRFLEYILKSGGADSFDGVSFHAYDYYGGELGKFGNSNWHANWDSSGPVLINKSRYLRALLNFYNRPDAYLINTETAMICGSDGSEPACHTDDHAQTLSIYLAKSNVAAQVEGLRGNIWYSINGWRASGLMAAGAPVPAYRAMQASRAMLEGMAFVAQREPAPDVIVYEFWRQGRRLWAVWSRDGLDHTLILPSSPVSAWDMYGESLEVSQTWVSTIFPVYLEWQE